MSGYKAILESKIYSALSKRVLKRVVRGSGLIQAPSMGLRNISEKESD